MSDEILIVDGLKKHFIIGHDGTLIRQPITVKAVDGVNFELQAGETFGLVGESGSGKSTIAYITVGMYQPTEGTMHFRGEELFARNLAHLSLCRADSIPRPMPPTAVIRPENSTNSKEAGRKSRMSSVTSRRVTREMPRSPWRASPSQYPY